MLLFLTERLQLHVISLDTHLIIFKRKNRNNKILTSFYFLFLYLYLIIGYHLMVKTFTLLFYVRVGTQFSAVFVHTS